MQIPEELAVHLVRFGVLESWRQIPTLNTGTFVKFLKERDIPVGNWQTLHHLWRIGVLNPIAVIEIETESGSSILDEVDGNRLIQVDFIDGKRIFADIGQRVEPDAPLIGTAKIPWDFEDGLLWHPFQLWQFRGLSTPLTIGESWGLRLGGMDYLADQRHKISKHEVDAFLKFSQDEITYAFMRIVALMLEAEPFVHHHVFPTYRMESFAATSEEFIAWKNCQNPLNAANRLGINNEEIANWHSKLAFAATSEDPIESLRKLIRHLDRDRREKFRDSALLAHSLYDHAELLRRYAEDFLEQTLPEETDVNWPERNARINREWFGSDRLTDFSRSVFRRIAHSYHADPGYVAYIYVEGSTEMGFVEKWFENAGIDRSIAGIRIVDVSGIGNIGTFHQQLIHLRDDEVFPFVCLDREALDDSIKGRHVRLLEKWENEGLLPIGFFIWTPNFVEANFSIAEIVQIVVEDVNGRGGEIEISEDEVIEAMTFDDLGQVRKKPVSAEDAIKSLLFKRFGMKNGIRKGERWGGLLADWAISHESPENLGNEDGLRPIENVFRMALRANRATYAREKRRNSSK